MVCRAKLKDIFPLESVILYFHLTSALTLKIRVIKGEADHKLGQ